ncbi:MAG: OB-fold nucleic acid binding domain-containing protein [Terriglobales bacterium]
MQGKYPKIVTVILLALATLLLSGCPPRESIARIDQTPGRFTGKEITIAGRVTNSFGAMGAGVFQLDDGSGRLWVFSENFGLPGRDAKLAVTGRLEEGFSFGGRHFATILRETRRQHY